MRRKPQTSIRFIAEVSNCSTASVSNVINGKGSVGEETRRRILENIKKYKYKVNRSARSLRTRTSSTIGIVFSPAIDLFQSEFYLNVIRGFHKRISREGFDLMLSETAPDSGVPRFVLNGKADAVAFLNVPVDAKTVRALRGYETPAVVLDAPSGLFDSVSSDGRSAGAEIFSYLDRTGYRSFAFFGLARDGANSETRMAGFVDAAKSRGADVSAKIYSDEKAVFAEFDKIAGGARKPLAVFACNDFLAYPLVRRAAELGFSVPDEIGFFGYGNVSFSSHCSPTLSSVDVDCAKLGERGAELLLRHIKNPSVGIVGETLPCAIVPRESVVKFSV